MARILSEEAFLALIETIVDKHHNNLSPTTILSRSGDVFVGPDKRLVFEVLSYVEKNSSFILYIRKDLLIEVLNIFRRVESELEKTNYTVFIFDLPEKETSTENKKSHQKKSSTKRK